MNIWLRGGLLLVVAAAIVLLERRRRARRPVERPVRHISRNLVVAGIAAVTVNLLELPVVLPVAQWVESQHLGLTALVPAPAWLRAILAIVLLDYTLYLWHIAMHRVNFLWRFHLVHHVDLDLDLTTALRFHAGELALSVPWRVAQVVVIGISPVALVVWQTLTLMSTLFHHSNSKLPARFEDGLSWFLVTPRMHAIHHSIEPRQTNSNFSSGLTIWDRLHRTFLVDSQADAVVIGVEEFQDPAAVGLRRILELPWRGARPAGPSEPNTYR